jgi:hypothetical protein
MAINVIGTVRYGTSGVDDFHGGSWNDVFHMTADDYITDNIDGEAGTDTVDYTPSQVGVKITLTDAPLKGGYGYRPAASLKPTSSRFCTIPRLTLTLFPITIR